MGNVRTYHDGLPRAIVDVTEEHGFDHKQLRVQFWFCIRGGVLLLPEAPWEVALSLGAGLVDVLPPQGSPLAWRKKGVTVEMEEAAWQ
eukprot:5006738-Amphidinium_carterae.1